LIDHLDATVGIIDSADLMSYVIGNDSSRSYSLYYTLPSIGFKLLKMSSKLTAQTTIKLSSGIEVSGFDSLGSQLNNPVDPTNRFRSLSIPTRDRR
jgi:hypothetical protein